MSAQAAIKRTASRQGDRSRSIKLVDAFDPRSNSLNLLRLVLAGLVLVGHGYVIGGFGHEPQLLALRGDENTGGLAVGGFFMISGLLVARSWQNIGNLGRYLRARALRILPGFYVCLLFTVAVFGVLAWYHEHHSMSGYVSGGPDPVAGYVAKNAFLKIEQFGIHGLLARNPLPGAFNGSLWTLFYEVLGYLSVAALGVVGVLTLKRRWMVVLAAALFWLAHVLVHSGHGGPLAHVHFVDTSQVYRLEWQFLAGVCLWLYREKIPMSPLAGAVSGTAFVVSWMVGLFPFVGGVFLAHFLIWLGIYLPKWCRAIGRRNDVSYGFYIYAFPVQQLAVMYGAHHWGIVPYTLLCMAITLVLAYASFRLIEKPALALKGTTRATTAPALGSTVSQ